MRVKLGNKWYDGADIPICIEFKGGDKMNIANMAPGATRYAIINQDKLGCTEQQMRDWIDDKIEL